MGRIASVDEGGVSTASYGYNQFDALNAVTQVDPTTYGSSVTQARSFGYSSLNRQEFPQNLKDRDANSRKISSLPGLEGGRGRNPW